MSANSVQNTSAVEKSPGPLRGLRVLELGGIGPGPFAAMHLADMGADVARVVRPGAEVYGVVEDPRHDLIHRGKRSVELDLKGSEGVHAALQLATEADVLIEGFRPGVAERLGLGPDECCASNAGLIYGRMTGWGQTGPLAQSAGHDIGYIAITGALAAIGPADRPPSIPLNLLGDFGGGGLYLVAGVLAALYERGVSGRGQVVDAAIVDGVAHLTTPIHAMIAAGGWALQRESNVLDGGAPFYGAYRTADGQHLAVGSIEAQFYDLFLTGIGLDVDRAQQWDQGHWPTTRDAIARIIASRTLEEWSVVFDGTDACVAPVVDFEHAQHHPQLRARGTFIDVEGIKQPAPAPRFSRTESSVPRAPGGPAVEAASVLQAWRLATSRGT